MITYGVGDTSRLSLDAEYALQLKSVGFRVGLFASIDEILENSPSVRDGVTVPYLREDIIKLTGGARVRF